MRDVTQKAKRKKEEKKKENKKKEKSVRVSHDWCLVFS